MLKKPVENFQAAKYKARVQIHYILNEVGIVNMYNSTKPLSLFSMSKAMINKFQYIFFRNYLNVLHSSTI